MVNKKFDSLEKTMNNINIELFDHGTYAAGTQWRHFNVSSPFCRLYFITGGSGIVNINGVEYELIPNVEYLIPPNINFDVYTDDHIEKFYLHFSAKFIFGNDIFNGLDSCLRLESDNKWLDDLKEYAKSNNIQGAFMFKAMVFEKVSQFLALIDFDIRNKLKSLYKYEDVYKYINAHLRSGLCAKEISFALNLSLSSLLKNHKTDTGITINKYIRNELLVASVKNLLYSDKNIKEIAADLDFCDEFYFSRFFKKQTGYSPKKYQMLNRF